MDYGKRSLGINTDKNVWIQLLARTPEKRTHKETRKSSPAPSCGTIQKEWRLSLQRTTDSESAGPHRRFLCTVRALQRGLPTPLPPAPGAAAGVLRDPMGQQNPISGCLQQLQESHLFSLYFSFFGVWGQGEVKFSGRFRPFMTAGWFMPLSREAPLQEPCSPAPAAS